jgi:hypothetical protein
MKFFCFSLLLICQIAFAQEHKKGFGLSEKKGFGASYLDTLNVSWYYNWDLESKIITKIEFVPMIFSLKKVNALKQYKILLAFNEPDHPKQANISSIEANEKWNKIATKTNKIGSPAIAGNLLKDSNWLDKFILSNPKVDFICVHWYKGCNPEKFISDMKNIIQKYQKPIWITEFAPQTASSSQKEPNKFKQDEINQFISIVCNWMNLEPMVYRYAWHDSKIGNTALFDSNGNLTETGKCYAKIK